MTNDQGRPGAALQHTSPVIHAGPLLRLLRTPGTPGSGEFLPRLSRVAATATPRHVRPLCVHARHGRHDGRPGARLREAVGARLLARAARPGPPGRLCASSLSRLARYGPTLCDPASLP